MMATDRDTVKASARIALLFTLVQLKLSVLKEFKDHNGISLIRRSSVDVSFSPKASLRKTYQVRRNPNKELCHKHSKLRWEIS